MKMLNIKHLKNSEEYILPNVSYVVENNLVWYDALKSFGHNVGDICLANANGDKKFIKVGDTIPDGYEPIGVVVIPSSHDVYGTGECAVLSLKYMNYTTPDEGSISGQIMHWGYDKNISTLTDFGGVPYIAENVSAQTDTSNPAIIGIKGGYTCLPSDNFTGSTCGHDTSSNYCDNPSVIPAPSPYLTDGSRNPLYYQTSIPSTTTTNTLSDFDGVNNTKIVTDLATAEYWKTATSIHNGKIDGYYPAACCCWRYKSLGTVQGDWYLPASGELGYVCARFKTINNAIKYLIDSGFSDSCALVDNYKYWSSSEGGYIYAFLITTSEGLVNNLSKDAECFVRAFLRVK